MKDIRTTTNYDMFVVEDWNRNIRESNIKKIQKNVEKQGWLKHPIIVNEHYVVMDGQHRLEYAKRNGLPVYYIVIPGLTINDCVTMNNVRMSWNINDYIRLYATQGNPNYIILQNLIDTYPFLSISTLLGVIAGVGVGGMQTQQIKSGSYEITAKAHDRAIEKLKFLDRVKTYILSAQGRTSAMFTAVAFAYECPGVNKTRLEKQIKNNMNIVTPPATLDMALKEIEYLYNYRGGKGNYVYIYTEYKKIAADRMLNGSRTVAAMLKKSRGEQ